MYRRKRSEERSDDAGASAHIYIDTRSEASRRRECPPTEGSASTSGERDVLTIESSYLYDMDHVSEGGRGSREVRSS